MITKITKWKCENPNCKWEDFHAYGSSSITYDENGNVTTKSENHCPVCGSNITSFTETVDLYMYNSLQECPKACF
jgi:hypothetical protein